MSTDTSPDPGPDDGSSPTGEPEQRINPLLLERRRVTVTLFRPGVEERLDELRAEMDELEAARLAGGGPPKKQARRDKATELAEEHDRLIREHTTLDMTFVEPYFDDLDGLHEDHPPRKGNKIDERIGYNYDTYTTALVRLCMVAPEVTEAEYAEFRRSVSAFNWAKIRDAVNSLVNQEPQLPKPFAVSALQQTRELASQQQRGTGHRRGGSRE